MGGGGKLERASSPRGPRTLGGVAARRGPSGLRSRGEEEEEAGKGRRGGVGSARCLRGGGAARGERRCGSPAVEETGGEAGPPPRLSVTYRGRGREKGERRRCRRLLRGEEERGRGRGGGDAAAAAAPGPPGGGEMWDGACALRPKAAQCRSLPGALRRGPRAKKQRFAGGQRLKGAGAAFGSALLPASRAKRWRLVRRRR